MRGLKRDRTASVIVAERFDRLEDALQICRSMFTQPQSTVHGKVARVDGAWNVPQPVQPGGPPIWLGGDHPDRR